MREEMNLFSRRKFLNVSIKGISLISISPLFTSFLNACQSKKPNVSFLPETNNSFPILEVKGSYYDIGYAIGSQFNKEINDVFNKRWQWFEGMKETTFKDNKTLFDGLLAASKKHFPKYIEEIKGLAEGSGISFDDMFLMNIKSETGALKSSMQNETPGCSTICYNNSDNIIFAHNEDGDEANNGNMFVVKATPPSGVSFIVLTYPSIIMGNGPGFNDHGIIQTTNYIASTKWNIGIPRYILGRAVLESKSLDEAIDIVSHRERAFAYHHNLGSFTEQKLFSVEVTTDNYQVYEPEERYFHTNHLILEKTKNFPQDINYISSSSFSRYAAIKHELENINNEMELNEKEILQILSSHQNKPFSPCRHPEGEITGRTLATAFFNINEGWMKLYKGNPCIAYIHNNYQIMHATEQL